MRHHKLQRVRSATASAAAEAPPTPRRISQAFLTTVIEKGTFGDARQDRGRFRSFLLGSLKHFLSNEHRHAATEKRGGGRVLVPLEFDEGERRYAREPADTTTPEETYEAQWARDVFTAARARIEALHADGWMRGSRCFAPLLEHVLDEAPVPFRGSGCEAPDIRRQPACVVASRAAQARRMSA